MIAINERDKQVASFKFISDLLQPEVKKDWEALVVAYLADRSLPSPYLLDGKGMFSRSECVLVTDGNCAGKLSEAKIRLELKKEEAEEAKQGRMPIHATSASGFLTTALHLEEMQYVFE